MKTLFTTAAPRLAWCYWVALGGASMLGANMGDVLSRELGLGHWRGLPVLAVLFGIVIWAARSAPSSTLWYWLGIVVVRAAATNLSDWQVLQPGEPPAVRSPLAFPIVIAAWSAALMVLVWRDAMRARALPRSRTDGEYWATMLVAGTVATAGGDWLAFQSGLHLPGAAVLTTIVAGLAYISAAGRARRSAAAFWLLIICIRTWGTNAGDLMADTIGLLEGTAISAALTTAVLYFYRSQLLAQSSQRDEAAQAGIQ